MLKEYGFSRGFFFGEKKKLGILTSSEKIHKYEVNLIIQYMPPCLGSTQSGWTAVARSLRSQLRSFGGAGLLQAFSFPARHAVPGMT